MTFCFKTIGSPWGVESQGYPIAEHISNITVSPPIAVKMCCIAGLHLHSRDANASPILTRPNKEELFTYDLQ